MRFAPIVLLSILATSSCIEWPDVQAPLPSRAMAGWPELQPTETLSTPAATFDEEELANATLQGRAAALRRRAILLRRPVTDQDDFERLRATLAR